MESIKKNFGFGCMRLPMKDGEVDTVEFSRMVDAFLENGFNYPFFESQLAACGVDYFDF